MKISELIEQLQTRYKPDDAVCAPIWLVEDIQHKAEQMDVSLTQNECELILDNMEDNHDACVGVNWDVIEYEISFHENDK